MPAPSALPVLPPGSDQIAAWARQRRLSYQPHPDQAWFRAWEPFDTMVSASFYFSAVSWALPLGSATIAEPWLAPLDSEPLDRTLCQSPCERRKGPDHDGDEWDRRKRDSAFARVAVW